MEPRSRETTPTKEDLDFIVDDGYRHDEDPDYVPNEKYLVSGKEFKKLTRNAKKLGAESLDYSTRKNNKYMATLPSGKKVHFGSPKYPDFTIHKDKERRDKYLTRATKIKNKKGDNKMSFNGTLIYPINPSKDIDLNGKYYIINDEFFYLFEKIEERLENLASKFSLLRYEKNKEILYGDISSCFINIASELRNFKNDLKK